MVDRWMNLRSSDRVWGGLCSSRQLIASLLSFFLKTRCCLVEWKQRCGGWQGDWMRVLKMGRSCSVCQRYSMMLRIIIVMSLYRSDSVSYYKMILPRESAWEIMNKLGQSRIIHIVPSNSPVLTKPFHSQIKRCEETLSKISTLEGVLRERKFYEPRQEFSLDAYEELYRLWDQESKSSATHATAFLNSVINEVESSFGYYSQLTKRSEQLMSKMVYYREKVGIIRAGERLFGRSFFTQNQQRVDQLGRALLHTNLKVNFKCGVIPLEDQMRFKKTVFRITKGNSLVSYVPLNDVFSAGLEHEKSKIIFFVLYPGQGESYLEKKISKLVDNFCDKKYELPTKESQFEPCLMSAENAFLETKSLLNLTDLEVKQYFQKFTEHMIKSKYFRRHEYLKLYLIKDRHLYTNLNEMDLFNNFLQGQIYVRTDDIEQLQGCLSGIEDSLKLPAGHLMSSSTSKFPTHYMKNDYTCSAQEIVETYGVARYKQANPAFFTAITFPFLFGVMFGDIAHGTLLLCLGLFLIFRENEIPDPLKILLPHRYLFAQMGFFAMYCGFIYNDFLSLSLNLFGSCFNMETAVTGNPIQLLEPECIYPFGLDPVWSVAENNLNFVNSLKMKMSVIIGVVHMTLGVFVKASNSLYFKKYLDFFFQFLPQIFFLILLFGYMDYLIMLKWSINWSEDVSKAPSIITTMINMPLKLGHTDDCCGGEAMYASQDEVQKVFLILALLCVPLMLLPKPLIQIYWHNPTYKKIDDDLSEEGRLMRSSDSILNESISSSKAQKSMEKQHDSGEIFVHQLIETIEYALGCISNTASYLRLWALSLAHSQLSEVFFEKSVEKSIEGGYSGIPGMLIGFVILSGATFGVLLCMDSMECFLHTLRLHWVQFQNKFYRGDGFIFCFFSFNERMSAEIVLKS